MKVHLLYADADLDLEDAPERDMTDLIADLELKHLFTVMARGDAFVHDVARIVVLRGLANPDQITYRQEILQDFLAEPAVLRSLYSIAAGALDRKKKFWLGGASSRPESVLYQSVQILEMYMGELTRLRAIADDGPSFGSSGVTTLLRTLQDELDDAYLATVRDHLAQLRFRGGTRMSARLGRGNEGTDYILHASVRRSWRDRLGLHPHDSLAVQIADRDEAGFQALAEIRARGLWPVAAALDQATQHITDFFTTLRAEAAFYVGCTNLAETLTSKGLPICVPRPVDGPRPALLAHDLYDPSLALLTSTKVFGNDIDADGASVVFITGANRGGKSTFLRGLGVAQLMMQCGLFVAARAYQSEIRPVILTHFKREEDVTMTSGKLDEELQRMSAVVDRITPGALLLCNESFASTNEREGSQIASEIVVTMRDVGIKVVYVTHMFELADRFCREERPDMLFLRAERRTAGTEHPFRLVEGEPLPTSFGADVYERVFGEPLCAVGATGGPTATAQV